MIFFADRVKNIAQDDQEEEEEKEAKEKEEKHIELGRIEEKPWVEVFNFLNCYY